MYPIINIDDLPWAMIGGWTIFGLLSGVFFTITYWRNSPGRQLIYYLLATMGSAIGAFLALIYYVLAAISAHATGS